MSPTQLLVEADPHCEFCGRSCVEKFLSGDFEESCTRRVDSKRNGKTTSPKTFPPENDPAGVVLYWEYLSTSGVRKREKTTPGMNNGVENV